jgi:hypothetical protein
VAPLGARLYAPKVGRHRLLGKRGQRRVEAHHVLVLLAEPADRDRPLGRFFAGGTPFGIYAPRARVTGT